MDFNDLSRLKTALPDLNTIFFVLNSSFIILNISKSIDNVIEDRYDGTSKFQCS